MRLAAFAIALAALSATATACSTSSTPSAPEAPDTSDVVSCDDAREQVYAPNMTQMGASGVFQFVLVSSVPAPPADQSNVFVLQVLDSSGNQVSGATITVVPTMPTMTHGTSEVQVTANADGSYTLDPLYFFMGGLWQTAIHVVSGSQEDSTSFFFCVPG
jgi:hypothetical protein